MDVTLPDGTVINNVPDGTTKAQLYEKLKKNGYDVSLLEDKTSALGTFFREAVTASPATAAALAAGSKAAALTPPVLPLLGPFAKPVVGLGAGAVAGLATAYGTEKGLAKAEEVSPTVKSALEAVSLDEATRQAGRREHPYSAIAGQIAAAGPYVSPLGAKLGERVLGAGIEAGIGAGTRFATGEEQDWKKTGIELLGGAAMSGRLTGFGEKLVGTKQIPVVPRDVHVPPTKEVATQELISKNINLRENALNEKLAAEQKLIQVKLEAEKNPNKTWMVENQQNKLNNIDANIAEFERRIQELSSPAKEQPTTEIPDVQRLENEYIEAKRRANEVSSKAFAAEKAGRTTEAKSFADEAKVLIKERDALQSRLNKVRQQEEFVSQGYKPEDQELLSTNLRNNLEANHTYFNQLSKDEGLGRFSDKALTDSLEYRQDLIGRLSKNSRFHAVVSDEVAQLRAEIDRRGLVPKTEGEAPTPLTPVKETTGEPSKTLPEDFEDVPLFIKGEDTSVQVPGRDVTTGDITQAFDVNKVRTWSDEALFNAIEAKEAKLYGSAEGKSSAETRQNIQNELDILYSEADRRGLSDVSSMHPDVVSNIRTVAGLRNAVETGGWRAGLQHVIANSQPDDVLSIISKALLKNKWINPEIIYKNLPKKLGEYEYGTENVRINEIKASDSATVLTHELVHRGTSNAINQWQADPSLLTSKERKAINELVTLYNSVKDLPEVTGKRVIKDLHEFLAYGLTYPKFASYLNTLPSTQKISALRRLINSVTSLLGFDPKTKSAYDDLLGIGKSLISEARAVPSPATAKANLASQMARANVPTIVKHTQEQLIGLADTNQITDIGSAQNYFYKVAFGKGQLKEIWDNPIISYVGTIVQRAENNAIAFKNEILNGFNPDLTGPVGKRIISTKQYIANNSVRKTYKALTDEQAFTLHEWDKRFFEEYVTVKAIQEEMAAAGVKGDWFEYHLNKRVRQLQDSGVSQNVIDAYKAGHTATHLGLLKNNELLQQQGRQLIPIRPDYYPAVRKGNFAVSVFLNDILYRTELFRTEIAAKLFEAKMQGYEGYTTKLEDISLSREGIPNLDEMADFTLNMFNRLGIDPESAGLFNALDQMTTTGMKFGKHQAFREGVAGYAGSEWFKSSTELGNAYKNSIFDWVDEQAAIRLKQEIKYDTERVIGENSPLQEILPNTLSMARHIRDMGTNNVPEWKWATAFDKTVRNFGDGLLHNAAKMIGKEDYVAKISPVDRVMGVTSSMFYMTTLMNRPGFWASQILTAPSSLRYILRNTEIPLSDIARSFSVGSLRSFGMIKYDKVSADVMRKLVSETTSLRPQLQNELNTLSWLDTNSHETLGKILRVATGQAPAEASDIFSRIWTANMMIEHFRKAGLKGTELADAVANAVENTMVSYTRSNKAAWVGKSGLVGQAANPLLTFGTAQLGNLVADFQFMARNKTLRSSLPFLSTMLVTQLMAGAIGLPILVEYQFLRDMLFGDDPEYDWMPNPRLWAAQQPAVIERGLVSAATGYDIGSGMRWNPFLEKFFMEDPKSLVDVFPAIAFMGSVGKAVGMAVLEETGTKAFTEAEKRKAYMGVMPFVGGKSVLDVTTFGAAEREYVPGSKSKAIVEQTPAEHFSTLLGSRTVERARIQDKDYLMFAREKAVSQRQSKYISLIADSIVLGGEHFDEGVEGLRKLGLTGKEITDLVRTRVKEYSTPASVRWLQGGTGPAALRKRLRRLELISEEQ